VSYDELVRELENSSPARERVATSVEIPFSQEAKEILQLAAAEADALNHSYIGVEHLLLGLLRRGGNDGCCDSRPLRSGAGEHASGGCPPEFSAAAGNREDGSRKSASTQEIREILSRLDASRRCSIS
jgi:ClpA/ClpB-like protein